MKRIYWLLLVLGIALLAGCGKKDTAAEQKEEKAEEVETEIEAGTKDAEVETDTEAEAEEAKAESDAEAGDEEGKIETVTEAGEEEAASKADTGTAKEEAAAVKDLSEVVDMNLTAADAAKKLGLIFETVDDDTHYFYQNEACDSTQGILWCEGEQYEDPNNWSYSPEDADVTVFGIRKGMTEEEVAAAMSDPVWADVTNYFGMAEEGDFYYENSENEFIVSGLFFEGTVDNVSAFCGKDF